MIQVGPKEVKKLLQENMENVAKMLVPLKVEAQVGKTWYDAN